MKISNYFWAAAVIKAHPDAVHVTRTRLQKTVWLLQHLELQSDYDFLLHFYGPYSEELQSDIGLLETYKVVTEQEHDRREGDGSYFTLHADPHTLLPDLGETLKSNLSILCEYKTVQLELAATYRALRELGWNPDEALIKLHEKKGSKCSEENMKAMDVLLKRLTMID